MRTPTNASAVRRQTVRTAAAVIVVGLVAGLASACDRPAEPANEGGVGVAIDGLAPLEVRNALVVTSDGQRGAFVAGIVNTSDQDLTLTVTLRGATALTVEVEAGSEISYGAGDLTTPPVLENLDTDAGSTVELGFSSEGGSTVSEKVPVLDESLDYLRGLAP